MHIPQYFRMDFAHAIEVVLFVMCGIMALAAVVAFIGLQRGLQDMPPEPGEDTEPPESSSDPALSAERASPPSPRSHCLHLSFRSQSSADWPRLIRIRSHEEGAHA